jgi:hypothetical protein
MSGWERNNSASLREQVTKLTTPSGRPASLRRATNLREVIGVIDDALSTSVSPVAMHMGIIHPIGIMAGKLNGAMPANTPNGSR